MADRRIGEGRNGLAPVRTRATGPSATFTKRLVAGWQLYVLLILPLAWVIIFRYIPMYGATIAFKDFRAALGILDSPWVGFTHFVRFVTSYQFERVMVNTLVLSLYQLIAGFPLPIVLAVSLNYVSRPAFKKSVQMITYAPYFISVVVMVGMILRFLDPRAGLVNNIVRAFGGDAQNFIGVPAYFAHVYVWTGVWQNVGYGSIIYLAALSAIDPELHSAAIVDGATKLQRIWHVDIPGILPTAMVLLIMSTGRILDVGFEKILLMQNPLNLRASEIIDTYVYKVGLTAAFPNYSYAAAIGLFKSIIGLIIIMMVNRLSRKLTETSLW